MMAPVLVKSKVMPPALVTALLRSKLRLKPEFVFAATVKVTGTVTVTAPNPVTVPGMAQTVFVAQPSSVAPVPLKKKLEAVDGTNWIFALVYVPAGMDLPVPRNCESVCRRAKSTGGRTP